MTRNSNDFLLGYARAQRDLSCQYTLGFYDRDPEDDRRHEIRVRVRRPGARALHPASYEFRSPSRKAESRIRSTFIAPEFFPGGPLRAQVFPVRPNSAKSWDGLLAVEFPVRLDSGEGEWAVREFGATLRDGSHVAHSFNRRISIRSQDAKVSDRKVHFVERLEVAPGSYTLTAVMTQVGGKDPYTAKVSVEVPEIPKGELLVLGPILGKRAEGDVVVFGGQWASDRAKGKPGIDYIPKREWANQSLSTSKETGRTSDPSFDRVGALASFEPLLIHSAKRAETLIAMSQACSVKAQPVSGDIRRQLTTEDGTVIGTLAPVTYSLDGGQRATCESIIDVLPTSELRPGRYVFTVSATTPAGERVVEQRFVVRADDPTPPPTDSGR
jgi:hypothetical protein